MHHIKTKTQKKKEKATVEKKQWIDNRNYWLFMLLMGCCVLYHTFLKPLTIGTNLKHSLFIVFIPTIAGIIICSYFAKKVMKQDAVKELFRNTFKATLEKIFVPIFALLIMVLISYVTLGSFADAAFQTLNYNKAKKSPIITIILPVDKFQKSHSSRTSNNVYFYFEGCRESFKVSTDLMNAYIAEAPFKHRIKLTVHKGIWNHYLVESFAIVK